MKSRQLNVGPDHLSRLESGEEPASLEDQLPETQLFSIQVIDDHFKDIVDFFTTSTASADYSAKQKK